jgi:restriction endonuclease S subunit
VILSEISTISAGHPFRGKIPEAPGSGIYAVQMKDVSVAQGINWAGCIETEPMGRSAVWLEKGDILIAARGNHNYAVLVEDPPPRSVAAPHFFVVRIAKDVVRPDFLVWMLNQRYWQRHFQQNSEGSTTKSIRRIILENVPIVIPSVSKQRAITNLSRSLAREHQVAMSLLKNGELMMEALVTDLLPSPARNSLDQK